MRLPFTKMHGLGNDYVVVVAGDAPAGLLSGSGGDRGLALLARRMCDRRRGVGADGLLWLSAADAAGAQLRMRIFNADGSEAEMCGNGLRCAVRHAIARGLVPSGAMRVQTGAGLRECHADGGTEVATELGAAVQPPCELLLGEREILQLSLGNPHAVLLVGAAEVAGFDLCSLAGELTATLGEPVNLEVAAVLSRTRVRQRTWERGVGETPACGTGAAAVTLAAHHRGLVGERVTVSLSGGDLEIELRPGARGVHAWQRGPAEVVFAGEWLASGDGAEAGA